MASIQGIYLAFFGRPADPEGLAFWEEQTQGGADLSVMLNALAFTEEYQTRFEGMSDAQIITSIYQSLFNRDPEPEGLAFFLEAMSEGTMTLTSIAVDIFDGAQGDDLVTIQNKEEAADLFTASLDTPEKIAAYTGDDAAQQGRDFISKVTSDPQSVPSQEDTQGAVNELPGILPPEEQEPGVGGGGGGSGSFDIVADEDGVVTFTGTAGGPITITNVEVDGDTILIFAMRGGISRQLEVEDFDKIVADGQQINIAAHVLDGLAINLTGGAQLNVDVSYEPLSSTNESLPPFDISQVSVNGEHGPKVTWGAVNVTSITDKFKLFWATGDAEYYDDWPAVDINADNAFIELGNIYATYLREGMPAILDIVQRKVGETPEFDTQQSLHDNLLGGLTDGAINSRFGSETAGSENDPRNDDAQFFADRPEEAGQPIKVFSPADVWDAQNGVVGSRPVPQYSISAAASIDEESGETVFTFTISRSGPLLDSAVSIDLEPNEHVEDYTTDLIDGAVEFLAGQNSTQFTVSIPEGSNSEVAVLATITAVSDGGLVRVPAVTADQDSDGGASGDAIYTVTIEEPDRVIEGENDLVFTVTRSGNTSEVSTVTYWLSGEATFEEDYIDLNFLSISFAPGQTTASIILVTLSDDETEEEEDVVLTLTSATDGVIDPNAGEAIGYIRDGGFGCVGPDGEIIFIDFDELALDPNLHSDTVILRDGYHGFIWGDWRAKDNIIRSQDEGKEPAYGWFDGIVSDAFAIYPNFGAQPGSVSVIAREEPFVLQSFYMSALAIDDLPVTLQYRDKNGSIVGSETFYVDRGEKKLIEPDQDIMYANCITYITFNQPQLGASFVIDDMTFIV